MRILAVILFTSLLFSCASVNADREGGDLTRSEVEYLSRRMRDAIEKEYPLLKHKLVNRYVDSLGQSLVAHASQMPPLPYEFRVLRTNEVLAFSLPGGVVYISLGLLRAVEMEGQLEAALAHELAHQRLGHPLAMWRGRVNANRGQHNLLDFSGDWKARFLGSGGAIYLSPGMEEEADKIAPNFLFRVHTDPRVYSSYIELLHKREKESPESVAAIQSLHPPFEQRMGWVKDGLINLPPQRDARLSSATFQEIKSILREAAKQAENAGKPKDRKK